MRAVDELWLVCGVSTAEIRAMTLSELVFWHRRGAGFFGGRTGAAPGSAAATIATQQIEAYVRGFRA